MPGWHRTWKKTLTGHNPEIPVWRVDPSQPCGGIPAEAAQILGRGGVLIYPTETFYGLGADPSSELAVRRIFSIKGREFRKPLPLIADRLESVRRVVSEWSSEALRLAECFWPGPLTLLLTLNGPFPPLLHGGTGKIALRVSSHPVASALAARAGGLLISTSANKSGQPAVSDLRDLPTELGNSVDGILDGGTLQGDLPSTLVDVTVSPPQLLREGVIPWARILNALIP